MSWGITLKGRGKSDYNYRANPQYLPSVAGDYGFHNLEITPNYFYYTESSTIKKVTLTATFNSKGGGTFESLYNSGYRNKIVTYSGVGGSVSSTTIPGFRLKGNSIRSTDPGGSGGDVTLSVGSYQQKGSPKYTNPSLSVTLYSRRPNKTNYCFLYGAYGSNKYNPGQTIRYQGSTNQTYDLIAQYASLYTVHFDVNPPVDIRYTDGTLEEVNCVPNDIVCAYLQDTSDWNYLNAEDNKQYIHHYPGRGLEDQDPTKPRLILKDYDISYGSYDKEGKQKAGVPGDKDENLIKNLKKDGKKPNPGDTIVLYAQGVPVIRKINYISYDLAVDVPENDPPEYIGTGPVEPKDGTTTWVQDHQPEYDLSAPHRGGTLSNNGIVNLLPNDEYGHRTPYVTLEFIEAAKAHSVIYGYDPKAPILGVGQDTSYKLHPAGQPLIGVNDGGPDLATWKNLESRPAPSTYDRIFYAVGKPASLVKMPSPSGIIGRPIHQMGVMTSEGGKVLDMVYLDTSEGIRPITGGAS